ncbi:uncharacterized protein LOC127104382 [Lathyrus oleraceus]|uniref:uncharacterized protein LOC127104382 n=1 Tax=Pisum sativum TaxID=3888 RepID=UPI0021D3B823|nr:uncharacterized protein LOC127104382 [Pisum sativum]
MDKLEKNQAALREEVSQVRAQMGQLIETIQAVARGQEIMAKMQEEMNQRAYATNPISNTHPLVVENPVPSHGNALVHIPVGAPGGVHPFILNPPVTEVDDQQDAFFSPKSTSMYDAFGSPTNEVEKKVKAIEEKLKAMESTDTLGIDIVEMCLVPSVVIPAKFKVPKFEKYKGASDRRTHIRAYYRKMVAYFDNNRLLMHFFQESLSEESLDWYMQLEGTHIWTWREMAEVLLKHY